MPLARGDDLRVVFVDGSRDHHDVGILGVFRSVTLNHARTERFEPTRGRIATQIGAAHLIALRQHHFRDTAHSSAADANKMNFLNFMLHALIPRKPLRPVPSRRA